ncbi:hypothetical protein M758_UG036900 [Ceratodon purpureus]|nr:hypothetical protein M758_UG036900 [Ceratodon purpureus]
MGDNVVPVERKNTGRGEGTSDLPWIVFPLSFFEDNEPLESYRYDPKAEPHVEVEFLDCLPRHIVWFEIWPKLMSGPDALANFRTCTELRLVCHGWVRDIDGTDDWERV